MTGAWCGWALELSESGNKESHVKEGWRCAVVGLTLGGEQTVLRAASLCHFDIKRVMGGRQDSIARMPLGVDEKQLVAHLCTLCQKVLSLVREPTLGVKRAVPFRRMGVTREVASLWHR